MRGIRIGVIAGVMGLAAVLAPTGGVQASINPDNPGRHSVPNIHFVYPKGHNAAGAAAAATPGPNDLVYSGGPVEAAGTTNYAIFWEPGLFSVSAGYNSLISRFFQDIGGSGLYGTASQYYQGSGSSQQFIANSSHFGGAWVDTSIYPGPVIHDILIQQEVTKAIAANGWTAGVGHGFFVFTSKNEVTCAGTGCSNTVFCAYHSSFVSSGGQEVLYADQPYTGTTPVGCSTPTSPNNNPDADSTINVVSHELMETVTDPLTSNDTAWLDTSGQENGDKCNFNFGPTNAQGADLVANGHPYIVQQEWSNAVHGCSMS